MTCTTVPSPLWSDLAIISTEVGAVVFVIAYAITTRGAWRKTNVGINVMALMSVIAVVGALAVATIFWGVDWPYRNVVRTAAWGMVAVCIWWRVAILVRVQRGAKEPARPDL